MNVLGIDLGGSQCRTALARDGRVELVSNRFSGQRLPPVRQRLLETEKDGADVVDLLKHVIEDVRQHADVGLDGGVITVPCGINERQRALFRDTVRSSGLPVVRLLDEPVAATLGSPTPAGEGPMLVYCLGASAFQAAVVNRNSSAQPVLAVSGKLGIAGDAFDDRLLNLLNGRLDGPADPLARRALAERIKLGLSRRDVEEFESIRIERRDFENAIETLIDETLELCIEALRDSQIEPTQLTAILLAGGSTRVPLVESRLAEVFPAASQTRAQDTAIARGAALYAVRLGESHWRRSTPEPESAPPPPEPAPVVRQQHVQFTSLWLQRFAGVITSAERRWQAGDQRGAINEIRELMLANLHLEHAREMMRQKRFADAIPAFRQAVQITPDSTIARHGLHRSLNEYAQILLRDGDGDLDLALRTIEEGLELDQLCSGCLSVRAAIHERKRLQRRSKDQLPRSRRRG